MRAVKSLVFAFGALGALGGLALLACSSKSGGGSSVPNFPAIDAGDPEAGTARYLPDLTLDERKALCDWAAGIAGGYGHTQSCSNGLEVQNFKDQATCLDQYLGTCTTVTVQQYVDCRRKEATDLCALYMYSADECKPVAKCIGKTGGGVPSGDAG